jgi:hypothetical protein
MKTFFVYALSLALGLVLSISAVAQTDFEKEKEKMRKEFERAKNQQKETFFKFRDEVDKKFVEALRQNWKAVNGSEPENPVQKPKPDTKPQAPEPDGNSTPIDVKVGQAKPKPPVVHDIIPPFVKPEEIAKSLTSAKFTYLSENFEFSADTELKELKVAEVSENGAALFWAQASNCDYKTTLNQIIEKSKSLNFNDWGFRTLVHQTANSLLSGNEAVLLEWLLLCKSGFAVRVGTDSKKFYLLLPISNKVYGSSYFQINGKNYYLMSSQQLSIRVHDKDFPNASNSLSLDITKPLAFDNLTLYRTLRTPSGLNVTVPYVASVIEFYKDYPWSEFNVYFDSRPSLLTAKGLIDGLKPAIVGKTEKQAVDLLLNFVQVAFDYATDEQQFGYEKPLFIEETIHYAYSDCEDRSFLFAFLVKELLGLEVVGLHYPGHLATAVNFSQDQPGDFLNYAGKKFIVCDPTYIGASAGMAMPQFAGVKAEVVVLK